MLQIVAFDMATVNRAHIYIISEYLYNEAINGECQRNLSLFMNFHEHQKMLFKPASAPKESGGTFYGK